MLTEERHAFILRELEQKDVIKAQDIVATLNTSESTIRRDLQILEDEGYLQRIHGGAKNINSLHEEPTMNEKTTKNTAEKDQIARYAAELLSDSDVIFLDAGSTTLAMIPYLNANMNLTVVTNGITHASLLAENKINTYVLGGQLKLTTKAIIGANCLNDLTNYRFNKVFLGVNGIHPTSGYTTPDPEEAMIKKRALQQSKKIYILADHSKFDTITFAKIGPLNTGTIITSKLDKQKFSAYYNETTIKEASL